MLSKWKLRISSQQRLSLAGVALVALGAAGGAGAMSVTRPPVEMAPTLPTTIAKLASARGIVTVRGRVAEVYGDRFIVQDATGRTLVTIGRGDDDIPTVGSAIQVQGRYDNGQLRARFLVDGSGNVVEVGPPPHHGRGPRADRDAPPPLAPDASAPPPPDVPPPPPPGSAPQPCAAAVDVSQPGQRISGSDPASPTRPAVAPAVGEPGASAPVARP